MKKIWLILITLSTGMLMFNTVGNADHKHPMVLVVYDSKNIDEDKAENVYSLNRLLVSAGCDVKMLQINDYKSGLLNDEKYDGIVTLINWPEQLQKNQALDNDRLSFRGIQIHIGEQSNLNEINEINGEMVSYYQRDWVLIDQNRKVKQHLPQLDKLTVFDQLSSDTKTIGSLKIQGQDKEYPYGIISHNQGYVPYYSSDDDSSFLLATLIKKMFKLPNNGYKPLLTINEITPYTDLELLNKMTKYLKLHNQTFVISTTIPNDNFDLYAYQKFVDELNLANRRGGLIFIKNPYVSSSGPSNGSVEKLKYETQNNINHLIDRNVYPIGVSLDEYWLRDKTYRQGFGGFSNTQILFKNPKQFGFAQQDTYSETAKNSIYAVDMNQINSNLRGATLNNADFNADIPLAVTFEMPDSSKKLRKLEDELENIKFKLFSKNDSSFTTQLSTNDHNITFSNHQYLVDNKIANRNKVAVNIKKAPKYQPVKNWGNRFFSAQNKIMWIFFGITFLILGIYLVKGRKIYLKMFRRHDNSERGD